MQHVSVCRPQPAILRLLRQVEHSEERLLSGLPNPFLSVATPFHVEALPQHCCRICQPSPARVHTQMHTDSIRICPMFDSDPCCLAFSRSLDFLHAVPHDIIPERTHTGSRCHPDARDRGNALVFTQSVFPLMWFMTTIAVHAEEQLASATPRIPCLSWNTTGPEHDFANCPVSCS